MLDRLALRKRRLLAALDRLEAGTFGRCCECSADIEPIRQEADATTLFCRDCQEAREAG